MTKRTKLNKAIFSAFIFLFIFGAVSADWPRLYDFNDATNSGCHDDITEGVTGTVVITTNKTLNQVFPLEVFTVTVGVDDWTENANNRTVIGFVNGTQRADNTEFSWTEDWQVVYLDANGDYLPGVNFTFTAPSDIGNYTIAADALYGSPDGLPNNDAPILFINNTLVIEVVTPAGAPNITSFSRTPEVEVGLMASITIDAIDMFGGKIISAHVIYGGISHTMINTVGDTYEHTFNTSTVGPQFLMFSLFLHDNYGDLPFANASCNINITDSVDPIIHNATVSSTSIEAGEIVLVTANVSDAIGIDSVKLLINDEILTMAFNVSSGFYYIHWATIDAGIHNFSIQVEDIGGNVVVEEANDTIEVISESGTGSGDPSDKQPLTVTGVPFIDDLLTYIAQCFSTPEIWFYLQLAVIVLLIGVGAGIRKRKKIIRESEDEPVEDKKAGKTTEYQ